MLKPFTPLRSLPRLARVSILTSLSLFLLYAFQWSIIDLITPFLFLPLEGVAWLLFVGLSIWSTVYWIRHRHLRHSWVPVLVCFASLCLVLTVPFTSLWLQYDFNFRRKDRERIVQEVLERKLGPALEDSRMPKLIALARNAPKVSMGGNEILALVHDGKTYVFFFTYRGILRNYAGFLYVPTDGDPAAFADLNEQSRTWIDRYDEHWFFASHR